jgi:hypothetical protein
MITCFCELFSLLLTHGCMNFTVIIPNLIFSRLFCGSIDNVCHAGSPLHMHHSGRSMFSKSQNTHHVKNFGLADFFVRKTLQIIIF